jgi:hypothetical protein
VDYQIILGPDTDNVWYCTTCIASMLPFVGIDDDIEYDNCMLNYCAGLKADICYIQNQNQLQFVSKTLKMDKEFDADNNYLKALLKNSEYVTELQLNALTHEESNSKKFSILHVNVRSIVKNIDNTVDLIGSLDHKFSVIAVTETWTDVQSLFYIHGPESHAALSTTDMQVS